MPPKKPAQPAGNKKTQEKKKEKIIEVKKQQHALADRLTLKRCTRRSLAVKQS